MRPSRSFTAFAPKVISTPGESVPEVFTALSPTPAPRPISWILLFVTSAIRISIVTIGTGLSTERRKVSTRATSRRSPDRIRAFRSGKVFTATFCFSASGMISSTFDTAR